MKYLNAADVLPEELIDEIRKYAEGSIKQIYHSAWSVGDFYILKEYSDQKALQRNIQMHRISCEASYGTARVRKDNEFLE